MAAHGYVPGYGGCRWTTVTIAGSAPEPDRAGSRGRLPDLPSTRTRVAGTGPPGFQFVRSAL